MTAPEWLASLVVIVGYVGALMWLYWRGIRLERVQELRFVCPRLAEPVSCRALQEVRIGQWLKVESCSVFPYRQPTCDRECLRLLNLGQRLPAAAA